VGCHDFELQGGFFPCRDSLRRTIRLVLLGVMRSQAVSGRIYQPPCLGATAVQHLGESRNTMLSIILLCETLTTGGAETFVLRLAQSLRERGHQGGGRGSGGEGFKTSGGLSLAPGVGLEALEPRGFRQIMRVDGRLQRFRMDFSWLRWLQQRWLGRILLAHRIQLVHSNLITCDLVAAVTCPSVGVPWLSTIHGDYLAFELTGGSRAARVLDFARAAKRIERSVSAVVCITDVQQAQIRRLLPHLQSRKGIRKIYNGYPRTRQGARSELPAILSKIPPQALVVGMVARGVREKGWDVLLEAARDPELSDAWLVLVGEGPRIAELRDGLQDARVIFAGNVTNPLDYIARFDIACLPSRYPSESLPTVIIEYLQQGKPVVASHVGEIPAMLRVASDAPAGLTIALDTEQAMAVQMAAALRLLVKDRDLRARLSQAALPAFEQFNMDDCVQHYEALYHELIRYGMKARP